MAKVPNGRRKSSSPKKLLSLPQSSSTPAEKTPNKKKSHRLTKANESQHKRRARPGRLALREIRYYQQTTNFLIPKLPFCRLVREVIAKQCGQRYEMRIQSRALEALQEAAETYLVRMFEDMQILSIHASRVTVMPKDLHVLKLIKND